ncbi:MAG TPA: hypothetical protein VKY31_06990 [Terriglobia bacterium]|nr:hypothetical protein [Terriglobia bacterium]
MSRIFQVMGLMVAFVMYGNAAEVVSINAVPSGKATNVVTAIKTDKAETIYHVWIYSGKRSGEVFIYDAATKTGKAADQADLNWLKERKIEGARMIVKLPVEPSPAFHTRSQKTIDTKELSLWRVEVYDSTNLKPIGQTALGEGIPAN